MSAGLTVCFWPCERHRNVPFRMFVGGAPNVRTVCPICDPPGLEPPGGALATVHTAESAARTDAATLARDAARYRVLRDHTTPRGLYDSLVRNGQSPGPWRDLGDGQGIGEKVDELCDAARPWQPPDPVGGRRPQVPMTEYRLGDLRRSPRMADVSDIEDLVSEVDRLRVNAELLERVDVLRRAAERGLGQAHDVAPQCVDAWQHVLDELAALRCRAGEGWA